VGKTAGHARWLRKPRALQEARRVAICVPAELAAVRVRRKRVHAAQAARGVVRPRHVAVHAPQVHRLRGRTQHGERRSIRAHAEAVVASRNETARAAALRVMLQRCRVDSA